MRSMTAVGAGEKTAMTAASSTSASTSGTRLLWTLCEHQAERMQTAFSAFRPIVRMWTSPSRHSRCLKT